MVENSTFDAEPMNDVGLQENICGEEFPEAITEIARSLDMNKLDLGFGLLYGPNQIPIRRREEDPYRNVAWIPGHLWAGQKYGPQPARIMCVGKAPGAEEEKSQRLWCGETSRYFRSLTLNQGLDLGQAYMTNVLKFQPQGSRILKWEKDICLWFLYHEIKLVRPELIFMLGSDASQAVVDQKITRARSQVIEKTFDLGTIDDPDALECKTFGTIHPAAVYGRDPVKEKGLVRDIGMFKALTEGQTTVHDKDGYLIIESASELKNLVTRLIREDYRLFAVDCEWGGNCPEDGKLRSIQFAWEPGQAAFVHIRDTDYSEVIPLDVVREQMARLLLREDVKVLGHNLRADDRWIRAEFGFSLMDRLHCDTMQLDHMIEENRPHDLTSCILRYTDLPRYDQELNAFLAREGVKVKEVGYKPVPMGILGPYGCGDVDGTFRVFLQADPELEGRARNLFYQLIVPSQRALAEAEETGFTVDTDRIIYFTELFNRAAERMEEDIQDEAQRIIADYARKNRPPKERMQELTELGEDFNPRSFMQLQELFFEVLELEPVRATDGSPWDKVKGLSEEEKQKQGIRPSTDKTTRRALIDKHQIVGMVDDYKTLYTPCSKVFKQFDKDDEGNIVPDPKSFLGLVHNDKIQPSIRDTLKTGRRATRNPNLQNLAGRANQLIKEALDDMTIPSVRTFIVAPPGYVLIGADYSQAELNTMAAVARDEELRTVLQDPMRDIHAEQAIRMYGLPYDASCGIDPKKWCKENGHGHLRDHAKTAVFGWSYGISDYGLYMQMTEAGVDCTVDDCEKWLELLKGAFPVTADYFEKQRQKVYNPGYVTTPWGRVKHLYEMEDPKKQGEQEREAANMVIQSTVGDLVRAAMLRFQLERDRRKVRAMLCPDQHDALYAYCHGGDLEIMLEEILPSCLGIRVPQIELQLDYEVDIYLRWGEKPTPAALMKREVPPEIAEKYGSDL